MRGGGGSCSRRRRALGGHRLAHRNLQDERGRSASLPARRARQDRRASSHGSDRRATAVRLRVGGRQGCGLTTPLTKQEVRVAEEFEDKKRRGRVRFIINAFIKLCGKLGDTYEHQPSNEAMARNQDIVAVTAIANFLDEVSGSKGDLAYFANRFAMLAQRLQDDATIASR